MKKLYTVLFLLLVYSSTNAQVLQTTNLNLNPGGVIHDVAYDSYYDAYIVVGEFSSINTQSCNNLAFIDASTLMVMSQNPITGINGAIRSVEVVNFVPHSGAPGAGFRNYIYLGGNFTSINTNAKVSVARLLSTHYYSQPPVGGLANYNLQTNWDAQLYWDASLGTEYGVHDFHLVGDTLIIAGEFNNVGASYLSGDFHRKTLSIDADHPTFLTKNLIFLNGVNPFIASGTEPLQGIEQLDDRLFLYGEASNLELINEYQLDGTFVQQIEYCNPNDKTVLDFEPHTSSVDTIFFAYEGFNNLSSPYFITSYLKDGSVWNCPNLSSTNKILNFPAMGRVNYVESYKDFVFTAGANTNSFFVSKRNGTTNVPILNSFSLNNNWFLNYPDISAAPCLEVQNNLLFFSTDALTSVDGLTRTGLAVFCLEPTPAEAFTQSDATACEGDSSIYTIPQAQCASGYRWSYTGVGALYRITGSGNPWAALSSIDLVGTNTNSIEVYYPLGATSGTLSVEPFTIFGASDNHYSQGESIAITVNPKPDITLASAHTLNCYSDTTLIVAQTSMSNVNFDWVFNNGGNTSTNDTILITPQNGNGFDSSNYIVTITNTITGCFNSDTTFFTFDTTAVQIDASLTTTNPNEWNCLTDSMTLTSNQTAYSVMWENPASPGVFYSDPFTIYSAPSGSFNLHGIQLSNGCATQEAYGGITVNQVSANPVFVSHPNFLVTNPDDSLSCANPTLTLQCDVEPAYSSVASAQWHYQGTPLGSDILNLTTADSAGMSFNTKVYTIVTQHSTSFCESSASVVIRFDLDKPQITELSDQSITCSQSEIILTHPLSPSGNVTEGWLDGTGAQTGVDTIVATSIGDYYYEVTSNFNGCSIADTVAVTQSLDLLLDMPTDTLICPDQVVTIAPMVIGNTETPSYLWSTGSTGSSENATGGVDSELIVTVSTPSGCAGSDTTTVSITLPALTIVDAVAGCTDGNLQIISTTGGVGPYRYSLNGSSWQTDLNFPGLAFDDYTIFTQDDLGCIYDTTQSLDGTASSVEMDFVASTYNEEGDTIVLVNVTDFTGLDSVSWTLPPTADVVFEDDSVVILSMAIGGWYDIELIGYLGGNCQYSYINPVYFGDHAPLFDSAYAENGIVEFEVLPNFLQISTQNTVTVNLEFGKSQNYTILVTNSIGQPIPSMSVSGIGQDVSHQLSFPAGTAAGAYCIHVIADYDAKQEMITLF